MAVGYERLLPALTESSARTPLAIWHYRYICARRQIVERIVGKNQESFKTRDVQRTHPITHRVAGRRQEQNAEEAYRNSAASKSDLERTELAKDKTGVFTGGFAINPVNGAKVPVWVADYVLMSYGTGAIMAVPAHDTRDFEFAQEYDIPIIAVVDPGKDFESREDVLAGKICAVIDGVAINSSQYNGLATAEFKTNIADDLAAAGLGRKAVNYKLRDWLFSRQRFWGEPFPILHELDAEGRATGMVRAVDERDLPVRLPELDDFKPHGRPEPPLDKAPREWLYPSVDGVQFKRETNTMPQPGCQWICTWAERNMPCCICSTRDFGTKCSTTGGTFPRMSHFDAWSTKA